MLNQNDIVLQVPNNGIAAQRKINIKKFEFIQLNFKSNQKWIIELPSKEEYLCKVVNRSQKSIFKLNHVQVMELTQRPLKFNFQIQNYIFELTEAGQQIFDIRYLPLDQIKKENYETGMTKNPQKSIMKSKSSSYVYDQALKLVAETTKSVNDYIARQQFQLLKNDMDILNNFNTLQKFIDQLSNELQQDNIVNDNINQSYIQVIDAYHDLKDKYDKYIKLDIIIPIDQQNVDLSVNQEYPAEKNPQNFEDKLCIICLNKESQFAALPCGHRKYCTECKDDIFKTTKKCAYCNKEITSFAQIYE